MPKRRLPRSKVRPNSAKKRKTTTVPLLPIELIHHIIGYVIASVVVDRRFGNLFGDVFRHTIGHLRLVCRAWRNIVDTNREWIDSSLTPSPEERAFVRNVVAGNDFYAAWRFSYAIGSFAFHKVHIDTPDVCQRTIYATKDRQLLRLNGRVGIEDIDRRQYAVSVYHDDVDRYIMDQKSSSLPPYQIRILHDTQTERIIRAQTIWSGPIKPRLSNIIQIDGWMKIGDGKDDDDVMFLLEDVQTGTWHCQIFPSTDQHPSIFTDLPYRCWLIDLRRHDESANEIVRYKIDTIVRHLLRVDSSFPHIFALYVVFYMFNGETTIRKYRVNIVRESSSSSSSSSQSPTYSGFAAADQLMGDPSIYLEKDRFTCFKAIQHDKVPITICRERDAISLAKNTQRLQRVSHDVTRIWNERFYDGGIRDPSVDRALYDIQTGLDKCWEAFQFLKTFIQSQI